MPGIWNVNSSYNVDNKRISTKLSFEVGEKFSARILDLKKSTGEILLKLLDGWQFSAEIENPVDFLPNKLVRLEVQGFENGKLKLKIVNSQDGEQVGGKDSIDSFIRESGDLNLSSDDYQLVKSMLKHEIPLTKSNISNIKTTLDFIDKIKSEPNEENEFIDKYLDSRGISPESTEGKFTTSTLKNFFSQLKQISGDDLLTFLENNMELSEDNIKSFNNVFKKDGTIYNEIKFLGETLSGQKSTNVQPQSQVEGTKDNLKVISEKAQTEVYRSENSDSKAENIATKDNIASTQSEKDTVSRTGTERAGVENKTVLNSEGLDANKLNEILNKIKNSVGEEKTQSPNVEQSSNVKEDISSKGIEQQTSIDKDMSSKNIEQKTGTDKGISSKDIENLEQKDTSNTVSKFSEKEGSKVESPHHNNFIKQNGMDDIVSQIKEQINIKTSEMKDIIRTVLDQKGDGKNQLSGNIVQVLNNNMNDFKVFNTVSNSYYYMDVPINLNQQDYQCKLMIKDDRQKGKKIDSTNVKIVTSVSTENMGTVDAYLSVKNRSMDIDIKCSKEWLNLFKKTEKRVLESLSDIGYNVYVRFDEKKEEMNISTCREFFQDSDIGVINTKA
ncbi:hypothetical protein D9O40_00560 [Clostridium autoethanogenum]|uniref:Flagellar hook-length control protein FliK n=2 Tax=Clostridium TaxID=1485 RepID=D8GL22_CLOLD|nr:conserved hypothetical protein [Clostridium ljungdahlii DSM 13528]OAA88973.1 hypothetical protein WX45_02213 [Clostridium ljungdahlii DSM 13528]RMD04877.1 hypothetical protein D9O40_00560 [Clostridium autoethanogenum]